MIVVDGIWLGNNINDDKVLHLFWIPHGKVHGCLSSHRVAQDGGLKDAVLCYKFLQVFCQ